MILYNVDPLDITVKIELIQWQAYAVVSSLWKLPTNHFVGINKINGEGRISSSIMKFDSVKLEGMTSSGRIYKLIGVQGTGRDTHQVWEQWKYENKVSYCEQIDII